MTETDIEDINKIFDEIEYKNIKENNKKNEYIKSLSTKELIDELEQRMEKCGPSINNEGTRQSIDLMRSQFIIQTKSDRRFFRSFAQEQNSIWILSKLDPSCHYYPCYPTTFTSTDINNSTKENLKYQVDLKLYEKDICINMELKSFDDIYKDIDFKEYWPKSIDEVDLNYKVPFETDFVCIEHVERYDKKYIKSLFYMIFHDHNPHVFSIFRMDDFDKYSRIEERIVVDEKTKEKSISVEYAVDISRQLSIAEYIKLKKDFINKKLNKV